ncbi:17330_t:CDS:2 [Cetraspora pellucida]|uniref:Large ribosomal subunit protein uL4m n=1 Tax=Cetraspora pellucida TaxID=1433469 RepID=A0A9N9CR75_9GLOM|nr:17330_t:CDS:2 [Cetraspora pellucida]
MWINKCTKLFFKRWQGYKFLNTSATKAAIVEQNRFSPEAPVILKALPIYPQFLQAWYRDFKTNLPLGIMDVERQVFGAPIRKDILQRAVIWQRDCLRQGTHSTKNRSEVSGTTRKWAPQKGRGKARVGSHRAPHWRGGEYFSSNEYNSKKDTHRNIFEFLVTCSLTPRSHATDLPRQVQELALRSALATKFAQDQLVIVQDVLLETEKTKELRAILDRNAWDPLAKDRKQGHSILILTKEHKYNLDLASRNLQRVHALTAEEILDAGDVYNIIGHEILIMDREATEMLQTALKPK